MSEQSDDAQRTLERKALVNVRGLLDKLASEERERTVGTRKLVYGMLAAALEGK